MRAGSSEESRHNWRNSDPRKDLGIDAAGDRGELIQCRQVIDFDDLEGIFRNYDGRPHWGKKHSMKAPELRPLYPMWDRFLELRRQLDPQGVFLTDAMRDLLGIEREER